ncbi:lytic murein transglycosylase B [Candidatus Berkiella aquae]|uniref:Lytic murein transglycosylase B n=1 Tax=Candidatus Berkiella aquae TaxID=295108 RepID=A0A0Q9YZU2_9GAMM|nr:lytic murein transglycosylase B [Candidatus Berkiella aquae]MCS5710576.1 lytic murein transglycosylase B [Candidatus Berkiella aquae]
MQKNIFKSCLLIAASCFATVSHAEQSAAFMQRDDVKAFVQKMVTKHQYNERQLNQLLKQSTTQEKILTSIAKPAEKLPWHRYEPIFMSDKRIQEGVAFWKKHAKTLQRAEKEYGVPAEFIVAILGVETFYGKHAGQYQVLDSLVTLAFEYPPRSAFFKDELEQFLLLSKEEKWDPTQIKGSYAGAMGNPQFISSSYRNFAVDFTGSGKRDLINSIDDSIGSVANYFKVNGWQKGAPVVLKANTTGDKFKSAIASTSNPKPEYSLPQLAALGISPPRNANAFKGHNFALVSLESKDGPEYWLGGQNFYVITRYNRSNLYAMAVYNLSQKIKAGYQQAV